MSHVVVASVGTHGDVLPYVALGRALAVRGHRVTLAANENFGDLAQRLGLGFVSLVSQAETDELLDNPDLWHPLKSGLIGARWGRELIRRQYDLLAELAQGEDVVLAPSVALLAARLVQETHGCPLATIYHIPWTIASSIEPPVMTGGWTLPKWAPRPLQHFYWRTIEWTAARLIGGSLNELRTEIGLPPLRRIFSWWTSPQLAIALFPDWYAPPQPDWPPQLRIAGFPLYDGDTDGELDPQVLAFCQSGPPPVVATFGTGMKHAEKLFRAVTNACLQSGRRGLLLARHVDQIPANLPPEVRHFTYVSLRRLLPHCSAIVHHGGIGTTAKSLAAGTPQLIIPHAWDQLDNACRVERLGAGVTLRRRHVSVSRLANGIDCLERPTVGEQCHRIAGRFPATDPMDRACEWIEELARDAQPVRARG